MNANPQMDLFPAPEEKSYPGANGVKLPYWEQDGKIIRIALSDKLILPVTHQRGGHIYTFVPGYGRLEKRGKNAKTSFLSAAAVLRRSLELNESIARHGQSVVRDGQSIVRDAKEQSELLRVAEAKLLELGAENARLRDELAAAKRQTPHVAEPQQIGGGFVLVLRPDLIRAVKNLGGDQVTMAQAFNIALIVGQLLYLVTKGCGKVMADGLRYIYGTYTEFRERYFFFLSERTIQRTFVGAESLGLVTSKQPEGRFSRRKYYALTPEAAKMAPSGKKEDKMATSSRQNGALQEAAKMVPSFVQEKKNTTDVDGAAQLDVKRVELYALTATTTDPSELVEKLKPHFPSHDVNLEMRDYRKYRDRHERPITGRTFVSWMLRADIRLSPPKRKPPAAPIERGHEEQIDPEQLARFQKEREDRKAQKAEKQRKALLQPEFDPEQRARFLKELEDHKAENAAKQTKALPQP
jgi:hypothetical protein